MRLLIIALTLTAVLTLAVSYDAYAGHAGIDDKPLLFEGSISPDYVIDGPGAFGQGQEGLLTTPLFTTGVLTTSSFASYGDKENNGVFWLIRLSGRGTPEGDGCSQLNPPEGNVVELGRATAK